LEKFENVQNESFQLIVQILFGFIFNTYHAIALWWFGNGYRYACGSWNL